MIKPSTFTYSRPGMPEPGLRSNTTKMNVHFRPPELDQPRYRPTTREERIPNLRDSIQRNSSSSSSSDEDGSSFEDSFEQMMENWADDDPLVLDQTG